MRKSIVTAFGLGLLPVAPGTWGTLLGVAVHAAAAQAPRPWDSACLCAALAATIVAGLALCPWAERHFGARDPRPVVLDEVAGYMLTALCLPRWPLPVAMTAAFVSSRVFDVAKPFPIRRLEKLPAGWGVMLDDLLASVYAVGACYLAFWVVRLLAGPN